LEAVLMQTQAGDTGEARLAELRGDLRKFVARRIENQADVDDVLQEVLLKIHRSASSLQDGNNLFAWVYTIARNAIVDHYRKRRPTISLDQALAASGEPAEDAAPPDALGEIADCLRPFLHHLPEKYRDPLILTDLEGMSQADLAVKLGLSLSGAKSRVQRAREHLKTMLLECCRIEFNAAGRVVGYQCKDPRRCS
jgi:RNA polymerase sigma-70 factor (ECF subfamily)